MENHQTKIFDFDNLKEAAGILKEGGLVAFPTETVFGLGAIANDEVAVKKVFEVKGRPSDNPLIVHIANREMVSHYVERVNQTANDLMDRFWPGPLTIIFPAKEGMFAPSISAGRPTVSLRMPNQLETLLLIEMTGFPLVGPSANLSGKPSPTRMEHVLNDLSGAIDGVVKAASKQTHIGVESTVVIAEDDRIVVLRPGAITSQMLSQLNIPVIEMSAEEQLKSQDLLSPGVKYVHYSPKQAVYLVDAHNTLGEWQSFIRNSKINIGVLADEEWLLLLQDETAVTSTYSLGPRGDIARHTKELYAGLRYLEQSNCEIILLQGLAESDAAHAYINRSTKAANYLI